MEGAQKKLSNCSKPNGIFTRMYKADRVELQMSPELEYIGVILEQNLKSKRNVDGLEIHGHKSCMTPNILRFAISSER